MSRWYENIPYGPLTKDDHDRLSLAQYEEVDLEVHRIAQQRRVGRSDYLRFKLSEMIAAGELNSDQTAPVAEIGEARHV